MEKKILQGEEAKVIVKNKDSNNKIHSGRDKF